MYRLLSIVLSLIVFTSSAFADTGFFIENKNVTLVNGSPTVEETTKTWITPEKARFETNSLIVIKRLDTNKSYLISKKENSYTENEISHKDLGIKINAKSTGETKKVAGFNAQKAIVSTEMQDFSSTATVYYSKDVGIDVNDLFSMIKKFPVIKTSYEPFEKLGGIPVYSEMEEANTKTILQNSLVLVKKDKFDSKLFEVSDIYTKKEKKK